MFSEMTDFQGLGVGGLKKAVASVILADPLASRTRGERRRRRGRGRTVAPGGMSSFHEPQNDFQTTYNLT